MSATDPSTSPDPNIQGNSQPPPHPPPDEEKLEQATSGLESAVAQNASSALDNKQDKMKDAQNESLPVEDHTNAGVAADEAGSTQPDLSGPMKGLAIETNVSESPTDAPPPPPEKDEAYLNPTAKVPPQSPANPPSEWNEKELPEVPGKEEGKQDNRENDSNPEIQSIMEQFKDPSRSSGQDEIMSPRLELAEQFHHFPPRQSSLDPSKPTDGQQSPNTSAVPSSPPGKQPAPNSLRNSIVGEESMSTRRSSTSTVPPLPEPEPDQPFDFHRFLEQLRHRTADPVAKFLRSFLHEFGKRQWMAHEQVKIISDFLTFIANKMAMCDVWREVSDSEFDNAKEGMEKLVMNRLYSQTFSPAIPGPPTIPRSASRSRRREMERLHGPWRRGQHQEDIERDDVLAQKMGIYSWVKEVHLDIPSVSSHGRRFLNLAQQELLKINGYRAPRDKVICILNCCKVIFGLLRNTKKGDTSADSFVPLLIYVVLQANPDHLVSNIQYILRFRNQDKLGGEAGYYLSSLAGAIQFIETLDRTSLTVSDEEFEKNVEAAVSAIAQRNREHESIEQTKAERVGASTQATPRSSVEGGPRQARKDAQSSDEDSAPVAGLLRTIQKPLSTIGRMFSDEPDSPQERPTQPVVTPQPGAPPRLSPNVYQPPRNSGEERRSGDRPRAQQQLARVLDAQDAAARQASAEDAEARRIQRAEHNNVVETLSNMFPNLDRDVIDDVVKIKEGRVGLAVDACLALSAE